MVDHLPQTCAIQEYWITSFVPLKGAIAEQVVVDVEAPIVLKPRFSVIKKMTYLFCIHLIYSPRLYINI